VTRAQQKGSSDEVYSLWKAIGEIIATGWDNFAMR
jgi:hypothetical protein